MVEENLRNIFNPRPSVVLKSIKSWARSNAWRRSFGALDLSNKLRIPSEFPIGPGTTKSYCLLTCSHPIPKHMYVETYSLAANIFPFFKNEVYLLLRCECLYLAFKSFLFLSAQFEPEESLTLIKISLKASKREKGLDEKFTKIKFQLLTSSLAARRVFSAYIHYKSTFRRLMSEMKFIFIKFPLARLMSGGSKEI